MHSVRCLSAVMQEPEEADLKNICEICSLHKSGLTIHHFARNVTDSTPLTADRMPPASLSLDETPAEHLSEALISSENLAFNVARIREIIGPERAIMGVVKANAYGHDAPYIATCLEQLGIRDFGVANIEEALQLRRTQAIRDDSRILAFCSPLDSHIPYYLRHDVAMTITDFRTMNAAAAAAKAANMLLTVHVKVDTGMGRLGLPPEEAMELLAAVEKNDHLRLEGIYTHFAQSTIDDSFTRRQTENFRHLCSEFEHRFSRTVTKHASGSGAIMCRHDALFDMVRPGIMLYGYPPDSSLPDAPELRPVMQFQTKIIFLKEVLPGTSISYNRTWIAPEKQTIATIAAGYADGYHRALSNRSSIMIDGRAYPQAGTVTMDQMMVNLGRGSTAAVGDTAVLFGWNGPSAADLADLAGTISYELLCAVSPRVTRVFI